MTNPLADLKRDVYTITREGTGYRATKFNPDLNPVAFYHIDVGSDAIPRCNCPQSLRGPCKHLNILDNFLTLYPERVDARWFFCPDTSDWFPPISSEAGAEVNGPTSAGEGEAATASAAEPEAREVETGSMTPVAPSRAERWGM